MGTCALLLNSVRAGKFLVYNHFFPHSTMGLELVLNVQY